MKNKFAYILMILLIGGCPFVLCGCQYASPRAEIVPLPQLMAGRIAPLQTVSPARALYHECHLEGKLRFDIFRNAMYGYHRLYFPRKNIITIIDFTRPSSEKRLFVIDLARKKILYHTYVAHGVNSGYLYAVKFSNALNSKESSLGFYETAETYIGKYGYSLRLNGLEYGINNMARERDIVMHGATYVGKKIVRKYGCIGRSWGCPALPESIAPDIINVIKDGTCLYIYADNKSYFEHSQYVANKKTDRWGTVLGVK